MSKEIIQGQTLLESEYQRKLAELAILERELTQKELELATLQAELRAFEKRYLTIVGVCFAELDEINAKIAEVIARQRIRDIEAQREAVTARARARASAKASGAALRSKQKPVFTPSEDLKKLYREVAKCVHPDLATDEIDRARRTRFMTETNIAYQNGDETRLHEILREWEESHEIGEERTLESLLTIINQKIAKVRERLRAIGIEIDKLINSDLFRLKQKVEKAESEGRDLLAEMVAELDIQIKNARMRLSRISFRQVAK